MRGMRLYLFCESDDDNLTWEIHFEKGSELLTIDNKPAFLAQSQRWSVRLRDSTLIPTPAADVHERVGTLHSSYCMHMRLPGPLFIR